MGKELRSTISLELELGNDSEDDDINIRMCVRTSHICRPTKEEAFTEYY
jgi:hypothetical protein